MLTYEKTEIMDLPQVFREALAIHDIMSTFGVPVDHIFAMLRDGKLAVVAQEGGRVYGVSAGPLDLEQGAFEQKWREVARAYNQSPRHERARLLDSSRARDCAVTIIAGLVTNGFKARSLRTAGQEAH